MYPSNPKFCHPYDPYDIQLEFMSGLYDCIQQGHVGIFESPTGTGKSLSLICGALTWLRDHKRRSLQGQFDGEDGDDWLAEAERSNRRQELLRERQELEHRLSSIRQQEEKRQKLQSSERPGKRARKARADVPTDEDEFVLDDYDSDNERSMPAGGDSALSASTRALLEKLHGPAQSEEQDLQQDELKIIFCSRTHSQLTQFVNELRRVDPPSTLDVLAVESTAPGKVKENVKHLPLGSRKNLCINEAVSRLESANAINERCLELQKPKTAQDKKCPYAPSKDNREFMDTFSDRAIAQIKDIEDIAGLGREMKICPYYASRSAIPPVEVLTLPYPLLLQKSARDALGVSVKDNIIVIDEAHNLMDAVADTFTVSVRLTQLKIVTQQLMGYVQRFKNRLKGSNRVYITQVIRVLNSITDCLEKLGSTIKHQDVHITAAQLMAGKGVDQIKPHKLLQYLHESKLTYKAEGYTESLDKSGGDHKGLLMLFQSFLVALMNPDAEGRFFATRQEGDITIRYILLDPREHFRDIVADSRAVILAGGTMSPMPDYVEHLFSYLPTEKLRTFSFGHVIPKDNMLAQPVVAGPTGAEFDFTFEKRNSHSMIAELGNFLISVARTVPDGIVVFFPSYDYLAQVVRIWRQDSIMEKLSSQKVIFEEARGVSADDLLRVYAQAIDSGKGALLLSVIGGKLSEGINFSDKLGRAVVCVGLPFPNASSGEWKAKIEHIESTKLKQSVGKGSSVGEAKSQARAAGRDFYENACMRAVNQSIGRAIRHRNDYAAILLVDRRFATERIRSKLPGWIKESMATSEQASLWPSTEKNLKLFFEHK